MLGQHPTFVIFVMAVAASLLAQTRAEARARRRDRGAARSPHRAGRPALDRIRVFHVCMHAARHTPHAVQFPARWAPPEGRVARRDWKRPTPGAQVEGPNVTEPREPSETCGRTQGEKTNPTRGSSSCWWTDEGWLFVLYLFNREVVGWSLMARMALDLVTDSLTMACVWRGFSPELMHHCNRGSQ